MENYIKNLGKVSPTVDENDHSIEKEYDRLTIVNSLTNKKTYISRKFIPKGVPITDDNYWMFICGYNVINSLDSNDDESALSAKAGKELKDKYDALEQKYNALLEQVRDLSARLASIRVDAVYREGTKIGEIQTADEAVELFIPMWTGTIEQYNSITKSDNVIYNIVE